MQTPSFKLLIALFAALICTPSQAQTSSASGYTDQAGQGSQWQLDVLIFDRDRNAASSADTAWTFRAIDWPERLPLDGGLTDSEGTPASFITQVARQQGVQILPPTQSTLAQAASKLNHTGRYEVISHYSVLVRQHGKTPLLQVQDNVPLRLVARDTRQESQSTMEYWLSAPDLAPPLDTERMQGWVQLDHDIHAILKLDISFLRVLPGVFPIEVTPDGRKEYFRDQVQQYRLQTQRKLEAGTIAYFDHPRIGVLARLTPVGD
jgi:hypothetical protein